MWFVAHEQHAALLRRDAVDRVQQPCTARSSNAWLPPLDLYAPIATGYLDYNLSEQSCGFRWVAQEQAGTWQILRVNGHALNAQMLGDPDCEFSYDRRRVPVIPLTALYDCRDVL